MHGGVTAGSKKVVVEVMESRRSGGGVLLGGSWLQHCLSGERTEGGCTVRADVKDVLQQIDPTID